MNRRIAILTILLFSAAIASMIWAGCTGDTKSGTIGDPLVAVKIESFSFVLLDLAALSCGFMLASVLGKGSSRLLQVTIIVVGFLAAGGVGWITLFYVEIASTVRCFPPI